jgi:ATP-dependent protease HslVU (ClpYQ) peptidase subunit
MGVSGVAADVLKLIEHFSDPEYLSKPLDHEIGALLIGEKHVYEINECDVHMIQYNRSQKLSVGSGWNYALSAMHLGLDAVGAVKHAIKHNVYCGGRVKTWTDKKSPKKMKVRKIATFPAIHITDLGAEFKGVYFKNAWDHLYDN